MLYELILINEIEQRAKIIFLSASKTKMRQARSLNNMGFLCYNLKLVSCYKLLK